MGCPERQADMNTDTFLKTCRLVLANYQPLLDYCETEIGAQPAVYLGTTPRLPADMKVRPVIAVEPAGYEMAPDLPGKLRVVGFATFFVLEGQTSDFELRGLLAREEIFRYCLQALDAMQYSYDEMQIIDVSGEPEYLMEYPNFAAYWTVTFQVPPSDGLSDLEGGAFG